MHTNENLNFYSFVGKYDFSIKKFLYSLKKNKNHTDIENHNKEYSKRIKNIYDSIEHIFIFDFLKNIDILFIKKIYELCDNNMIQLNIDREKFMKFIYKKETHKIDFYLTKINEIALLTLKSITNHTNISTKNAVNKAFFVYKYKNDIYMDGWCYIGLVGLLYDLRRKIYRFHSLNINGKNPDKETILDTLIDLLNYCAMLSTLLLNLK